MPRSVPIPGEPLSPAEVQVLCLVALGKESAQGATLMHTTASTFKDHIQALCTKLGAADRGHAVQLGYTHGWLRLTGPQPSPAAPELPGQPRNVLIHIARGLPNADIARVMWISEATVKTQIARAYKKLSAHNRAHAVHLGFTTGNLRLGPVPARPEGKVPSC